MSTAPRRNTPAAPHSTVRRTVRGRPDDKLYKTSYVVGQLIGYLILATLVLVSLGAVLALLWVGLWATGIVL